MGLMTFHKSQLLTIIKENRDKHRAVFEEAQAGYRTKVIEELDKRLADARAGRRIDTFISLTEPVDQTRNYDRVIKMLEMFQDDLLQRWIR